jgi:peroxiredoxin (alkyl hydroperoxide reductase subunit C)
MVEEGQNWAKRRCLRIGDRAPVFHARSTLGPISLTDYRGRWVLLFSHPADFTPVCTSEFIALARATERLAALDCVPIAVSVDSIFSHQAWVRAIHEHFGVSITFPIIEDPSLVIGAAYGMIDEMAVDASAMRSTFVIDPEGVVRAVLTYPATVGRSVEEQVRLVAALQKVDADAVLTPESWQPGDAILLPPHDDAGAAIAEGDPCWFHRLRPDGAAA